MSQRQRSSTTRSRTTVDAVQSPRPGAGPRTTRGFAAFVAVTVTVAVTAIAPGVVAAAAVGAGVIGTTTAAVRRVADRMTAPPGHSKSAGQPDTHAAD